MSKLIRKLLPLLLIPAFFAIGLSLGPKLTSAYRTAFPPAQYATGDHTALYAKAGYSAANPLEVELRYNTSTPHRRLRRCRGRST